MVEKRVGKPGIDFVGVGVGVMVRNGKGEMLLGLRTSNCRNEPGKWTAPGGCVEFGETLEHAAVRETKEEYGIDVGITRLLVLHNHFLSEEKQHWVNPIFEAKLLGGQPKPTEPDKIVEVRWFPLNKLPKNISSTWVRFFKEVKEGKIQID